MATLDSAASRTTADDREDATRRLGAVPPLPAERTIESGTRLGRYTVQEAIGEGGMGQVFRATDPRLQRDVAIKLLRVAEDPGPLDTRAHARLRREARAMAQLNHPNVLPIYDVLDFGGQLVIAMELVEGETLRQWLQRGPDWHAVVDVFVAAGRGLAAAHAAGFVHRDFKPTNVLVGRDGRVRVMDFGLARVAESVDEDTDLPSASASSGAWLGVGDLTRTGMMMGTPAYMAPEQHRGTPADPRSDQFAFCVALFEGLTGKRPYIGQDNHALVLAKVRGRIDDSALRRRVPRWLAHAIERGLRPDPSDRWPSMDALLRRLSRPVRRTSRGWVAAIGGVGLLGAVGWMTRPNADEDPCRSPEARLEGAWDAARAESMRTAVLHSGIVNATGIADTLGSLLDERAESWTREYADACTAQQSAPTVDGERRLDCLERRRRELGIWVDTLLDADARVVTNALAATRAIPLSDSCRDPLVLASRVQAPEDPHVARRVEELRTEIARAKGLQSAGQMDDAKTISLDVVGQARTLGYPPIVAEGLVQLGSVYQQLGRYHEAETAYAEAFWTSMEVQHDRGAMSAATELTFIVGGRLGRFDEALEWAGHARAALDRAGNPPLWQRQLERGLSGIAHRRHDFATAVTHTRNSLRIAEDVFGPDHPQVAESLNNLGVMLQGLGELDEAERSFGRAIDVWSAAEGPDFPPIAAALNNLAMIEEERGQLDAALEHAERALALWSSKVSPDHPRAATSHNILGAIQEGRGDYDAAEYHYGAALAIMSRTLGKDHLDVAGLRVNLGSIAEHRGDAGAALAHYRAALAVVEPALGPEHADAKKIRDRIAGVQARLQAPT